MGGLITDIPKELGDTRRSDGYRKVIGSVIGPRRSRSRGTSDDRDSPPPPPTVPANMKAILLQNLVFHELCALLNSAIIYVEYKRYVWSA